MKYILNQQLKRVFVIVTTIGYTYLQLRRMHDMSQLDWYMTVAVIVLGIVAVAVTTAKIKIVSAHIEHNRQESQKHAS